VKNRAGLSIEQKAPHNDAGKSQSCQGEPTAVSGRRLTTVVMLERYA
jgi:hypothetical protein